jgi:hypothetical protein
LFRHSQAIRLVLPKAFSVSFFLAAFFPAFLSLAELATLFTISPASGCLVSS